MTKYLLDYYDLLKINRDADLDSIEKGYNEKLRLCKDNPKKTVYVKDAYIVLTNDKKRKKYDELLKTANVITEDELFDDEEKKKDNSKKTFESSQKSSKNIFKQGKGKYASKGMRGRGSLSSNSTDSINLISKLFNLGSKGMGSSSVIPGAKLLLGGATAAYGIKKGKDYMNNRKGGGKNLP